MEPWPDIPPDVVKWFRKVFAAANRRICERLANVPNIRETSLDDGFIEALIPDTAPILLPSGAIVRMDAHNIGGLRKLRPWDDPLARRWEVADIAILVFVYRGPRMVARKIGLLQSKRLYPTNNDVEEGDEIGFRYGMNAFLRRDEPQAVGVLHRTFDFDDKSIYGALVAGDHQTKAIDDLNKKFGKAVYYLFYNPPAMPLSVSYPVRERLRVKRAQVGCRVFDADYVHKVLKQTNTKASPTFAEVNGRGSARKNWPLEKWAADMLLTCKVGERFDASREDQVQYFLERRSGPIGAALAASITLPDER